MFGIHKYIAALNYCCHKADCIVCFFQGSDDVIVHIYVKQINKDSLTLRFEDRKLTATFSTS